MGGDVQLRSATICAPGEVSPRACSKDSGTGVCAAALTLSKAGPVPGPSQLSMEHRPVFLCSGSSLLEQLSLRLAGMLAFEYHSHSSTCPGELGFRLFQHSLPVLKVAVTHCTSPPMYHHLSWSPPQPQ